MSKKPSLSRRISPSTPPSTTRSRRNFEDDYPSRGRRCTHSVVDDHRPRRGRSIDSNDTYYNPKDKYYLTGSEDENPHKSSHSHRRGRSRSLNPLRRNKSSRHSRSTSTSSSLTSSRSSSTDTDHHYTKPRRHQRSKHRHHSPSSRSSSPTLYSRSKSRGPSSSHHEYAHSQSSKSRSRSRLNPFRRHRSPSPPPKQHHPPKTPSEILLTATKIAVETAALTALKLRDDPSPLIGPKGGKIAAAALSAAVVDTFIDKKHPKVRKGGLRHTVIRQATQLAIGNIVGGGKGGGKQKGVKGEGVTGKLKHAGRRRR